MREAFERWAVVEGLPVNKGSKKEYLNAKTRLAWRAWKAGVQTVMNRGEIWVSGLSVVSGCRSLMNTFL